MQSKNYQPTRAHKHWHDWLANTDCAYCGSVQGNQVHHCAGASAKHKKVWIGQWWCIGVCPTCHEAIHQHPDRKILEKQMFCARAREYMEGTQAIIPSEVIAVIEGYHR